MQNLIDQYDPQGMRTLILNFPQQAAEAVAIGNGAKGILCGAFFELAEKPGVLLARSQVQNERTAPLSVETVVADAVGGLERIVAVGQRTRVRHRTVRGRPPAALIIHALNGVRPAFRSEILEVET